MNDFGPAGAVSGTVGGVAGRTMTTGSLNQAMSDPKAIVRDAEYGAGAATVGQVVTGPIESVKDLNVTAAEKLGLDSAQTTSYANGVTALTKTIKGGVSLLANQLRNPPQQQNHLKPPPPSCNKDNGSCM